MRKKRFFYNDGVFRCNVETYPEFTVKALLHMCKDMPAVMCYLPDVDLEYPRMIQREFLINIMATCDHEYFDKAVNEAKANRLKNKGNEEQEIHIDPKLAAALEGFINLRKVSGRSSIGMLKFKGTRKRPVRSEVEPLTVKFRGKCVKRNY